MTFLVLILNLIKSFLGTVPNHLETFVEETMDRFRSIFLCLFVTQTFGNFIKFRSGYEYLYHFNSDSVIKQLDTFQTNAKVRTLVYSYLKTLTYFQRFKFCVINERRFVVVLLILTSTVCSLSRAKLLKYMMSIHCTFSIYRDDHRKTKGKILTS